MVPQDGRSFYRHTEKEYDYHLWNTGVALNLATVNHSYGLANGPNPVILIRLFHNMYLKRVYGEMCTAFPSVSQDTWEYASSGSHCREVHFEVFASKAPYIWCQGREKWGSSPRDAQGGFLHRNNKKGLLTQRVHMH